MGFKLECRQLDGEGQLPSGDPCSPASRPPQSRVRLGLGGSGPGDVCGLHGRRNSPPCPASWPVVVMSLRQPFASVSPPRTSRRPREHLSWLLRSVLCLLKLGWGQPCSLSPSAIFLCYFYFGVPRDKLLESLGGAHHMREKKPRSSASARGFHFGNKSGPVTSQSEVLPPGRAFPPA